MINSLIWAVIFFCILCALDTKKMRNKRIRAKKNREFGKKYNIKLKVGEADE